MYVVLCWSQHCCIVCWWGCMKDFNVNDLHVYTVKLCYLEIHGTVNKLQDIWVFEILRVKYLKIYMYFRGKVWNLQITSTYPLFMRY